MTECLCLEPAVLAVPVYVPQQPLPQWVPAPAGLCAPGKSRQWQPLIPRPEAA